MLDAGAGSLRLRLRVPKELEAVHEQALRRSRATVVPGKTPAEAASLRVQGGRDEASEDGDDAVMDDIWGNRFSLIASKSKGSAEPAEDADDGETPTKKKVRLTKKTGVDNTSPAPAPSPVPSPIVPAPASGSKAPSSRQVAAQLDKADMILLSCKQMFGALADNQTVMSITSKAVAALASKVTAALSSDNVNMYTCSFSGAGATRGLTVLQDLQAKSDALNYLAEFATAMYTKPDGTSVSAEVFRDTALALEGAGIKIAPVVKEMIVSRKVSSAVASKNWDEFKVAIYRPSTGAY